MAKTEKVMSKAIVMFFCNILKSMFLHQSPTYYKRYEIERMKENLGSHIRCNALELV